MSKTVFTGSHKFLVETLIDARKRSGLTQTDLAIRLGKDQTYISLIERSQRRVDVLEFYAFAKAMNIDPNKLFGELVSKLPDKIEI